MAKGIERDAIADFEIRDVRADFDYFARRFVPKNHRQARDHPLGAEFPIHDVQVAAANSARPDANEQRRVARCGDRGLDHVSAGRRTGLCDRFDWRTSSYLQYDGAAAGVKEKCGRKI